MQARLLLEDGTLFTGLSFGAEGNRLVKSCSIQVLQGTKRCFLIRPIADRS